MAQPKPVQKEKIYLSAPHMGGREQFYVQRAFDENWIAPLGPNVDEFEATVAQYSGLGHAAAMSSGTAALHLAVKLLGLEQGDTVFCSSFTFAASANPIVYDGGVPVFIDAEPESWNMSPSALETAFEAAKQSGKMPKAVIVANIYGQSARFDVLKEICDRYNTPVIEDAAESLGASYKGQKSGSFGKLSIFSFNGNKMITTSGGGMLVSNDSEAIQKARYLSTQARQPAAHYEHTDIGYNYRLSNVLAGIGIGQMEVLDERVKQRRQVFDWYTQKLVDQPIDWMPEVEGGYSTRWLTACTFKTAAQRNAVMNLLAEHNVESRPLWKPLHMQPVFADCAYFTHGETSLCSDLFDRGLCLPSSSFLTEADIDFIASLIKKAL